MFQAVPLTATVTFDEFIAWYPKGTGALADEPQWAKESIITRGSSVRLIVETTSTNWGDDYALKLEEYEDFGIYEYWIVDYLGLGGTRFIGNPKRPTLSIYQLVDGEYQVHQFREIEWLN